MSAFQNLNINIKLFKELLWTGQKFYCHTQREIEEERESVLKGKIFVNNM